MIKEREHIISRGSQLFQTILTVVVFSITYFFTNDIEIDEMFMSKELLSYVLWIIPVWWFGLEYSRLTEMTRDEPNYVIFFWYLRLVSVSCLIMFIIHWVQGEDSFRITQWLIFGFFDLVLLFGIKISIYQLMKILRRKGYNSRQVLILADKSSGDLINGMLTMRDWGYRVWGVITDSQEIRTRFENKFSFLNNKVEIKSLLDNSIVDEVIYAKSKLDYVEINILMEACAEQGVVFRLRPAVFENMKMKGKFIFFNDTPFYIFRNIPDNYFALKIKRIVDISFSLITIILFSPVFLVIAALIKLGDGGPVFFIQERVGLNGRRFSCLKFRTMVVNAETLQQRLMARNEQTGPVFKMRMDPRITRVGKFLRKTSLDELPQFFNVLNGDMSVVGPRPPIPSEVRQYKHWQNRRLSMKPGITCIWQVSGRNNISFDEWMELDMEYIDNWSLKLDFLLVLKTIRVMIIGDGQ